MGKKKDALIESEWNEFRNSVYEIKSKSQDDFEKYINLLASGGLAITIAFFDKIVNISIAKFIWLIIIGWIFLVLTLLLNLISHHLSINYSQKTIDEINNKDYDSVFVNVNTRNKKINKLNKVSIGFLITGIISIVIFITLNLTTMNNNQKPPQTPQTPKPLTEEKGRAINTPPQTKPSTNPKK